MRIRDTHLRSISHRCQESHWRPETTLLFSNDTFLDMGKGLARIMRELEMYAPYRFPVALDWSVPFHAVIPPPHPLFASVIFSNHLERRRQSTFGNSMLLIPLRSAEAKEICTNFI